MHKARSGRGRHSAQFCALLVAAAGLLAVARPARASSEPSLDVAEEQAFRRAALSVGKSVVRIQTVGGVDRVGQMLTGTAATTGVVVSDDGFIVSSAFNFVSKPSTILIQVEGARQYAARLVATDHLRMLALLKIDGAGLVPLRPNSRNKVEVGQWAIAVGRTYDSPAPSVSVGIVSAVNRVWGKAIQTDAKVSPVNYGGPLVDVAGNVLGVIVPLSPTAKEETAGVEWYDSGIGFAIPFDDVLASAERLKRGKDLFPGLLGVTMKEGGIDDRPTIDHVRFDSPAERAGLKSGDVFADIDGHAVHRHDEVKQVLGRKYAGDRVAVVVQRGGSSVHAEATLTDALPPYEPGFLGILPARRATPGERGIVVRFVFPHSAAAAAGMTAGDRIQKWNGADVAGSEQLAMAVRHLRPGASASAVILHGNVKRTTAVKLTADIEAIPTDLPANGGPALPQTQAKKDATKPRTGHFRDKLPGESGPSYWAYVPESYGLADAWGLIVWIAPPRDSMEAAILGRWQTLCEERHLLLVAPLPAETSGFNPNDLIAARQVVEHFLKTYRVDRNRVVLHSFTLGGRFAAALAFENREQIRGLALASSMLAAPPPESHPNYPFRFFFSYAKSSPASDRIGTVSKILREMKYAVTLQTTIAASRVPTYPDAEATAELARWVDSLDRI
jgi:serine protease Do